MIFGPTRRCTRPPKVLARFGRSGELGRSAECSIHSRITIEVPLGHILSVVVAAAFAFLALPVAAIGAEDTIDHNLNTCMDEAVSTRDMVDCYEQAYVSWDQELNQIYKNLTKRLGPDAMESMRQSQLAWLKHRDAEFKFLIDFYTSFYGSIWQIEHISRKVQIVKSRVSELKLYAGQFNDAVSR